MDIGKQLEAHEESQLLARLSGLAFRFVYPLAGLLALAVLAGGLLFLVRPKYESIAEDINQANREKTEKKEQLEKYLGRLNSYNAKYNALSRTERDRIDHILPDGRDQEFLYALLEGLAANQGVVLTGVKLAAGEGGPSARGGKEAAERPGLNRIKVTANFAGADYQVMLKILSALEGDLRFYDIDKVAFSPDQFGLGLEMTTYYFK